MKIRKSMKNGCAWILALTAVLALPCLDLMQARAAGPVIQEQECGLTVSADTALLGVDANAEDLNEMTIPVKLYKVADVDVSGVFTSTVGDDLNFNVVMDKDTNAATWENLAEETVKKLTEAETPIDPAATEMIENGNPAVFEGLQVGMYLVAPQDTFNADYSMKYVFTPYLTALPSSEYTLEGLGSDDWIYDRTISLKGEAVPQFGKLTIQKTLNTYNASLGKMTCVFEIEGTDKHGDVKYSDVVSITLDNVENGSITVENIPAGLNVKVTEVYAGGSYEIAGEDVKSTEIVSDPGVEEGNLTQAAVDFANQYNGGNRGGYGVTNEFSINDKGEWEWTDPTSPAPEN
ncbi:MAG: DUF5979 domain-containing protein [Lachnospiraceae bacterium]